MSAGRKMWLDPAQVRSPINSYLKHFEVYDDDSGSPTSDAYEPVILFTPAELKSFAEEIWKAARESAAHGGAQIDDWRFYHDTFADYWKERNDPL